MIHSLCFYDFQLRGTVSAYFTCYTCSLLSPAPEPRVNNSPWQPEHESMTSSHFLVSNPSKSENTLPQGDVYCVPNPPCYCGFLRSILHQKKKSKLMARLNPSMDRRGLGLAIC